MKALVKYGQRPDMFELRDLPEPQVRPGNVIVQVKAVGICGWDVELWKHRMAFPVTVPITPGHEFSGVITEIGQGVQGWQVGDRVTAETSQEVCGRCYFCRTGDYQLCPHRKGFGSGVHGAFTKYVLVRQEILHRLPERLTFEQAAITEPLAVAHHALVNRVRVMPGDTVMVIGPGPVGLTCLQMAKVVGTYRTILLGTNVDKERIAVATEHGWADHIILVEQSDPLEETMRITDGAGADVVADCAGNNLALSTALKCVRRGGQIIKIGWGPKPFNESLDILLRKSVSLVGTFAYNWPDWQAVLALMDAQKLETQPLISGTLPLDQWRQAFERVDARQAIKMILIPT